MDANQANQSSQSKDIQDVQETPAVAVPPATPTAPPPEPPKEPAVTLNREVIPEQEGKWIEEGLYYQGDAPPVGPWSARDWIEIPHEHYIPISKSRLIAALWGFTKSKENDVAFGHFLELLEAIYHFHYHKTLNELKEDYEYFSPETGEELRVGVPEEELYWRERRFLSNFIEAMTRGNFTPFGQEEYSRANEQNYLFDLAVEIKWDIYEQELIKDFIDETDGPEGEARREKLDLDGPLREFLDLPDEYDERMMLFYRGIDCDKASGLFPMRKVDVFLNRFFGFFIFPVQWVVEKLRGDTDTKTHVPSLGDAISGLTFGMIQTEEHEEEATDEVKSTTIFDRRWLRRVNLENKQLKISDVTKVSDLQEPALERVIAVFRLKPPAPSQALDKYPTIKRFVERFVGKPPVNDGKDWSVNIKMFKHIPLADSEIIFPEKRVKMKSFDLAMLSLTGIIGVAMLIKGAFSPNKGLLAVIVGVLLAYVVKIVIGYRRAKANYMARMTKELYHKSLDNDVGVLQYLVDSLEDQEVKEAMLAYFFLWEAGEPLSEDDLDGRIEGFLHENFDGIELDFEVDDALDKVIFKDGDQPHKHIPIVKAIEGPDGETLYEAVPLEEALRVMDEKWDNFYEYNV